MSSVHNQIRYRVLYLILGWNAYGVTYKQKKEDLIIDKIIKKFRRSIAFMSANIDTINSAISRVTLVNVIIFSIRAALFRFELSRKK